MDYILNSYDFVELSIQEFIDEGYARIVKASELGYFDGVRDYLSTSSIGEDGIESIECTITFDDRPSRASMKPIKNSIWFAKMKESVKVYQSVDDDENRYVLSTGFYGLLCNEEMVSSQWILELFKSDYFNLQKDRFSEGSSMSGIKDSQLSDIQLKIFVNRSAEKYHIDRLSLISKKLSIETALLVALTKQKRFFLNAMFI